MSRARFAPASDGVLLQSPFVNVAVFRTSLSLLFSYLFFSVLFFFSLVSEGSTLGGRGGGVGECESEACQRSSEGHRWTGRSEVVGVLKASMDI